jgi:RNA:NAD 2'-phosphotransferase (TPT1/KptA family)
MSQQGYLFYRSESGIWLTEEVPPQYLEVLDRKKGTR